jgi:hypothetical protein
MKYMGLLCACVCAGLGAGFSGGIAVAAMLPDSERLAPVRSSLEKIVDQAARDGLPSELIVSKVREGLAKGVAPESIRLAAERLAQSLGGADQFLKMHRKNTTSAALIRAVAEANISGVDLDALDPVVASDVPDGLLARAIEVLTDLALRGYPSRRAALVVKQVLDRDSRALGRLVAGIEEIRIEQTVSRADALESLGRNLQSGAGGSFDVALTRSLEGSDRAGNAAGASSPGKSGQAPGHQDGSGAGKSKRTMGMSAKK